MHHTALLDRRPHRARPGQPFLGRLTLAEARVHELCGPARHTLAGIIAGGMTGPVLWVRPGWEGTQLHGPGLARLMDPGRVVFVEAPRPLDLLWTLEEALRSGAVPLVVGDMPGPPALTPMRRLQLACEAGAGQGVRPLGLVLTPEGASPGAESRWHMAPAHGAEEGWHLTRERERQAPPRSWHVGLKDETFALGAGPEAARPH
ncbi:MAG: ImuA family protein [Maritimibacter harenae]